MAGEELMKYSIEMIVAAVLVAFFAFATHTVRGDVLVSTNFDSAPFQAGQTINGRGGFSCFAWRSIGDDDYHI